MIRLLRQKKARDTLIQTLFLGVLLGLCVVAVVTAKSELDRMGITSGFSFLEVSTGFGVGFSIIEFSPNDSYGHLLWISIVNTIVLGVIGIVLANLVGLMVAVFRTSSNTVLNTLGTVYVELFRNVPLILQIMFWYAILVHLPKPKEAYSFFDLSYLSARGLVLPSLNVATPYLISVMALVLIGGFLIVWYGASRRFKSIPNTAKSTHQKVAVAGLILVVMAALWLGRIEGTPLFSIPELKGLNFRGGLVIPPEFTALAVGMAIYGGAYLGEIFRSGFMAVGQGQIEAANALGLKPLHVFTRVRLPLAIRAILPTLINQYVWLFKATTLGIVVGYTDFFSVVTVAITQSGQTLELIGILMVGFLIMNNTISIVLNRVNKAIALKGNQLRQ
jgi:general L-amino acid transport system permease protein